MFHFGCFPPLPLGEGRGEGGIAPRLSSPPVMTQLRRGWAAGSSERERSSGTDRERPRMFGW